MHAKPIAAGILRYMPWPDFCRLQRVCRGWRQAAQAIFRASGRSKISFALTTGWMVPPHKVATMTALGREAQYRYGTRPERVMAYYFAVRPEKHIYEPLWEALSQEHPALWNTYAVCQNWWYRMGDSSVPEHPAKFFRRWFFELLKARWIDCPHSFRRVGQMRLFQEYAVIRMDSHLQGRMTKAQFATELNALLDATRAAMHAHYQRTCLMYNAYLDMFPDVPESMHELLWRFFDCAKVDEGKCGQALHHSFKQSTQRLYQRRL